MHKVRSLGSLDVSQNLTRLNLKRRSTAHFVGRHVVDICGKRIRDSELCPSNRILKHKDFINLGTIGRGSCGVVYLAWDTIDWRLVALKCISIRDNEKHSQILQELSLFQNYPKGERSVGYFGGFFHDEHIWLVLEYCACGSLEETIQHFGPMPETELKILARQIAEGIRELHEAKLIHRDIKPGNILLTTDGDIKLTDFGILESLQDKEMCTSVIGTHLYMSPNRLRNKGYDYKSDVWSFGLTLIFLVTGRHPFDSQETYTKLILQDDTSFLDSALPSGVVSEELYDLLEKCLDRDPKKRLNINDILQHKFIQDLEEHISSKRYCRASEEQKLERCNQICKQLTFEKDIQYLKSWQYQTIASQLCMEANAVKKIFRSHLLEFYRGAYGMR